MSLVKPAVITELNESTYEEITLPANNKVGGVTCAFYTEDGSSYTKADDDSGANAVVVPASTPITYEDITADGTPQFYALAATGAGTPNLIAQVVKP